MKVKIKKLHDGAVIPSYAKEGDAAMDLTAVSKIGTDGSAFLEYGTGISVAIPEGYVGLIFPRSSVSKTTLSLCNAVGVVDSGYRGEIKLRFRDAKLYGGESYKVGDRVAQLMIIPRPSVEFEEVEDLDETDRGLGGFGSSGE